MFGNRIPSLYLAAYAIIWGVILAGSEYCSKCGIRLVESAKYCYACGNPTGRAETQEYSVSADDLVQKVKQLIKEGNVSKIIVKDEKSQSLLEIPVTVGVVGAVLAPLLAAVAVIAALATNCTIVVEKKPTIQNH